MEEKLLALLRGHYRALFSGFLLLGLIAAPCADFHVENRIDAWVSHHGKEYRTYQQLVHAFGNDESLLAVFPRRAINTGNLDDYLDLVEQLQGRPEIAAIYDPVNRLLVNALGELPDARDLDELRLRMSRPASAPLKALISDDLDTLGLVIRFKRGHHALRKAGYRQLANAFQRMHIPARFGGTEYFSQTLTDTIRVDLQHVIAGLVSLSILVMFAFFRKWRLVAAILTGVGLSLVYTVAFASALGIHISLVTLILFPLLFLVGITSAIHLYARRRQGVWQLDQAWPRIVKPSFIAALTTALGVSSFAFAPQQAVADMGVVLPAGVLFSFLVSLLFVPAAQRVLGGNWELPVWPALPVPTRWRRGISVGLLALGLVSIAGVARVKTDPDAFNFFKSDAPLVRSYRYIETHLTGLLGMDLVFSTADGRALTSGEHGRDLHVFLAASKKLHAWTQTVSALALAQQSAGDPLAQSGLQRFFSGNEMRASLHFRNSSGVYYPDLAAAVHHLWANMPHAGLRMHITGLLPLTLMAQDHLLKLQAAVFPAILLLISIVLAAMVRSFKVLLLALLVNFIPLLIAAGSMPLLHIKINSINLFVASVILGVIVDDTIHLLHAWRRHGATGPALAEVQPAIRMTTLTVLIAFASLFLSRLTPMIEFGALSMIAVAAAYACDVYLLPALLEVDSS